MADETLTQTEQPGALQKGEHGLNPGVKLGDVPADQTVRPNDPGIPKAPEVSNKPPVVEPTAEEKAKLAEAEALAAKEKADKEAADKAAEEAKNKEEVQEEYVEYGHPSADAAVAMLKESGITPAESSAWFKKAAESGNIADIDYAAMEAKLGKDKATLVKTAVQDYYTSANQSIQKTANAVLEIVGGRENFDVVKVWAETRGKTDAAFASQFQEFVKMFDLGEHSARLAAKELKSLYEADPKNKSLVTQVVSGDGVPGRDADKPLTRSEYLAAMKTAQEKGDNAEIARLRAQRLRSIG